MRMITRLKICGITSVQDAATAVAAGADAIGLVFYPDSPRCVSADKAREIISSLPPFITTVGLFVNASQDEVKAVLDRVALDLLQFHGKEDPGFCVSFGRPYIKAVRVRERSDLDTVAVDYSSAAGVLLDSYQKGVPGGTGETFNWGLIPPDMTIPVILAGGLKPSNVAEAIRKVCPYAVDVSSGVESSPGVKNEQAIHAFARAVSSANTPQAL